MSMNFTTPTPVSRNHTESQNFVLASQSRLKNDKLFHSYSSSFEKDHDHTELSPTPSLHSSLHEHNDPASTINNLENDGLKEFPRLPKFDFYDATNTIMFDVINENRKPSHSVDYNMLYADLSKFNILPTYSPTPTISKTKQDTSFPSSQINSSGYTCLSCHDENDLILILLKNLQLQEKLVKLEEDYAIYEFQNKYQDIFQNLKSMSSEVQRLKEYVEICLIENEKLIEFIHSRLLIKQDNRERIQVPLAKQRVLKKILEKISQNIADFNQYQKYIQNILEIDRFYECASRYSDKESEKNDDCSMKNLNSIIPSFYSIKNELDRILSIYNLTQTEKEELLRKIPI